MACTEWTCIYHGAENMAAAEAANQTALTDSLGQPTCAVDHGFHFEWFGPPPTGDACPGCGAQV